jgi:sugar phosphate isomerase/epimerase
VICFDPYVGTLGKYSPEVVCAAAAAAGFDGINVPVTDAFVRDQAGIDALRGFLERFGLVAPTLSYGKPAIPRLGEEQALIGHGEMVFRLARAVGAGVVGLWPHLPEGMEIEEGLDALAKVIAEIDGPAADAGCVLAVEFEPVTAPRDYRATMDFIHRRAPWLKVTVDTTHVMNTTGDQYRCVVDLRGLISDVHLSGHDRGAPSYEDPRIDFDALMRGLRDVGFDGPLVAQYHLTDLGSMGRVSSFMRQLVASWIEE